MLTRRVPVQVDHLDGIFAFVLMNEKTGEFMAARDPIGVVSLYWGWGRDGSVCFASEMKGTPTTAPAHGRSAA